MSVNQKFFIARMGIFWAMITIIRSIPEVTFWQHVGLIACGVALAISGYIEHAEEE